MATPSNSTGRFAQVASSVADSVVTIEAVGDNEARRAPASSSTTRGYIVT